MSWKPKAAPGVDTRALGLSSLHDYVLAHVDGELDEAALAEASGLTSERLAGVLHELVSLGALDAPPPGAAAPPQEELPPLIEAEVVAEAEPPEAAEGEAPEEPPSEDAPEAAAAEPPTDDADEPVDAPEPGTHRQLFETTLHHLPIDERAALAGQANEPELSALCFDPVGAVVRALFDNPRTGLPHARLVAKHHRTAAGLEALATRAAFAADAGVRRGLLHNPLLPQALYRRLWGARRMLEQHHVTISREVPEQTRRTAREVLRARFANGPSEEKAELILKTEGRCLAALVGLPIDSKTTSLLCHRTYASTLFIQNLARWSAAPPQLVAHLLRQDLVRRTPMLRTLLERHPNAPKSHR